MAEIVIRKYETATDVLTGTWAAHFVESVKLSEQTHKIKTENVELVFATGLVAVIVIDHLKYPNQVPKLCQSCQDLERYPQDEAPI